MFKNFWWPLAMSNEVSPQPIRITALQQEFALYRLNDGSPQVLSDLCVHRGGALSDGWLAGECIVCPYHGWEYTRDGACVKIPANPAGTPVPRKARVDAYPTVERYGFVWGFLGDIPEAERPPFPELSVSKRTDAATASVTGVTRWRAPYAQVISHFAGLESAALSVGYETEGGANASAAPANPSGGAWHVAQTGTLTPPARVIRKLLGLIKSSEPVDAVDAAVELHAPCFTAHRAGSTLLHMAHVPVDDRETITRWVVFPGDATSQETDLLNRVSARLESQRTAIEAGGALSPEVLRWQTVALASGWGIDTHLIQAEYANIKAVVIPSPARRESPELAAAWVLKEIPTKTS
jgi:phenylpropionate dioxygenase-like ring-hydroxylating dioxygenase large terminal subunit